MRASIHYCLSGPHKGQWSVTDRRGTSSPTNGKVITHVDHAVLHGATFKVSEASRQAVIAKGQRSVHARVWGNVDLAERGTQSRHITTHGDPGISHDQIPLRLSIAPISSYSVLTDDATSRGEKK